MGNTPICRQMGKTQKQIVLDFENYSPYSEAPTSEGEIHGQRARRMAFNLRLHFGLKLISLLHYPVPELKLEAIGIL